MSAPNYRYGSNSCGDISFKTRNYILIVALEEVGEVIMIPLGSIDMCTKLNGNTSNRQVVETLPVWQKM